MIAAERGPGCLAQNDSFDRARSLIAEHDIRKAGENRLRMAAHATKSTVSIHTVLLAVPADPRNSRGRFSNIFQGNGQNWPLPGPAAYPCLLRSMATARAHRLEATSGWRSRGTRLRDLASGLARNVEGLIAGPGRRGIAGKPSHI
jgi:hypothetical protein